jgi:hypothetical protein
MKHLLDELLGIAPFEFWYLATPYTNYKPGPEAAFVDACQVAAWLMRRRVRVFCPIAHSHPIETLGGRDLTDHDIWLPADAPFMHAAYGLIVCEMPGWEKSYGMQQEREKFRADEKPIWHLPWPLPEEGEEE